MPYRAPSLPNPLRFTRISDRPLDVRSPQWKLQLAARPLRSDLHTRNIVCQLSDKLVQRTSVLPNDFRIYTASDIDRDGLGVELVDNSGDVLAEVFRSDRKRTVTLTTFRPDLPLSAIRELIRYALERLDPFEDGTPLSDVEKIDP